MKKKALLFVLLISCWLFSGTGGHETDFPLYHDGLPRQNATLRYLEDEIIVKPNLAAMQPGKRDRLLEKYRQRLERVEVIEELGLLSLKLKPEHSLLAMKEELAAESWVADVSLNYLAGISRTPNDQFFNLQYALRNTGQTVVSQINYSGTSGSDIKAVEGWDWSISSEEVIVAVIDTGVHFQHEDLKNKLVPGYNFVHDNNNPQDDEGHGTMVASIIAAESNNGIGIAGVAWNARIMPIKALNADGVGSYVTIALAIRYAADQGARIVNLSLGGPVDSFILRDACQYAVQRGLLLVAATGNDAGQVRYPAAYNELVLAVGASDANDQLATFSNFGPQVDLVAPGVYILCALFAPAEPENTRAYVFASGTSMAAPHVAGAAALVMSLKPGLSAAQVAALLRYTADDVNYVNHPGVDNFMGYGRLNLKTLLAPFLLK